MLTRRVLLGARVDPDNLRLARDLAKKMYGSEKRLGYVMDDAIRLLHTHETNPKEAQAYLSNIENQVLRSLEKRIESVGERATQGIEKQIKQATDRTANLIARIAYETALTSLMQEEICIRAISNFKEIEPQLRKEASQRMKGKFTREGEIEAGTVAEENERLREEIKEYKEMISRAKEVLTKQKEELKTYEDQGKELREQLEEYQRQERENEYLVNWMQGLEVYLRENYSRLKSNETLIEEYSRSNPRPRVV